MERTAQPGPPVDGAYDGLLDGVAVQPGGLGGGRAGRAARVPDLVDELGERGQVLARRTADPARAERGDLGGRVRGRGRQPDLRQPFDDLLPRTEDALPGVGRAAPPPAPAVRHPQREEAVGGDVQDSRLFN